MLTYATRVDFEDLDHSQAVIRVQSKLTYYQVAFSQGEITIVGPGLEENIDAEELPNELSFEGKALLAVLLFEERSNI